jgi:DNA adenine methylase
MIVRSGLRTSAPIKWHGGKTYLAARIVESMPEHIHYVEPFFGGGAVFFSKPNELIHGHSEVVNDIFGELVNFWQVLQSKDLFPEFERSVTMTPFAKPVWEDARNVTSDDPVQRAWAFFVRYRQSRQGLGRDFATMSRTRTRRGMNEQASSWLSAIDGLASCHERLQRVVIYCEDAINIIRREDDANTFFYCDPPYVAASRVVKNAYSCEMTDEHHMALLDTMANVKGRFLLSGYPNAIYERAERNHGWRRVDIMIDNKASSRKTKPTQTECLWSNY